MVDSDPAGSWSGRAASISITVFPALSRSGRLASEDAPGSRVRPLDIATETRVLMFDRRTRYPGSSSTWSWLAEQYSSWIVCESPPALGARPSTIEPDPSRIGEYSFGFETRILSIAATSVTQR